MALTNLSQITTSGISTLTDVNLNYISGIAATFTGNVTVGGTLTYDDVTNVDSVGLITARSGIIVSTGTATTALVVNGNARITGILTVGSSSLTFDGTNNVVNVGTALTLGHTQGLQFHTQNLHSQGFEINNVNATGIVTATSGLHVTGGSVGIGTADPQRKLSIKDSGNTFISIENTSNVTSGLIGANSSGLTLISRDTQGGSTAKSIQFITGSTEKLHIKADGRIGIGTNEMQDNGHFQHYTSVVRHQSFQSNTGDLAIVTDNNSNPAVYIKGTGTADLVNVFDNTTEVFTIKDGGNVGIGLTNPVNTLHVLGAGTVARLQSSTSTSTLRFHNSAANDGYVKYISQNLTFTTADTERLRINSAGLVGIGTDNPSGKLNIVGSDSQLLNLIQDSGDLAIRLNDRGTGSAYIKVPDNSSASLTFETGGSERLRITSDGVLSLRNSSPPAWATDTGYVNATFGSSGYLRSDTDVNSNFLSIGSNAYRHTDGWKHTNAGWATQLQTTANNGDLTYSVSTTSGSADGAVSWSEKVRVTGAGKIGIGKADPYTLLHVHGTAGSQKLITLTCSTLRNNYIGVNGSDNLEIGADEDNEGNDSSIRFRVDGSEKLRISDNGDLSSTGPDTSSATIAYASNYARLDLRGTNVAASEHYILSYGVGHAESDNFHMVNKVGNLIFRTGSSTAERLHIKSDGKIAVGSNDNTAYGLFQINQESDNDESGLGILSANSARSMRIWCDNSNRSLINSGDGGVGKLVINQGGGSVGINSMDPAGILDVRGQVAEDNIFNVWSFDKDSRVSLWPSDNHDADRWRMAFWENNGESNNNPDWMVDGYGRQWMVNNLYIGRTRTFADAPGNYYPYYGTSGPAVLIYNGVDGDTTTYSASLRIRCYQTDTDDRNIFYYAYTSTTAALDDDQHQRFGVKGSGRVQGMRSFYCGRVESDETTPNSVYSSVANGIYAYDRSAEGNVRMVGYATPTSTNYSFYAETGTSTANDDIQFKVRSTDGRIYSDYGASVTSGADYAESFEWHDGNPDNEDRVGYSVVLQEGKIRKALDSDNTSLIMGIISAAPAVLGDSADLKWQGRYLKDDFGREIMQDVELLVWNHGQFETQPDINDNFRMEHCDSSCKVSEIEEKLASGEIKQWVVDQNLRITSQQRVPNPNYNSSNVYVPRSERPEWDPVGLMGKLWLRPNQPTGDRWVKLRDGDNGLTYWLVR